MACGTTQNVTQYFLQQQLAIKTPKVHNPKLDTLIKNHVYWPRSIKSPLAAFEYLGEYLISQLRSFVAFPITFNFA